ncbi:hypothetical protein MUK42_33379, partial [Musa troglodytarum]
DSVAPPLLFDLYVGVNLWRSINITEVFTLYEAEIITAAPSDSCRHAWPTSVRERRSYLRWSRGISTTIWGIRTRISVQH